MDSERELKHCNSIFCAAYQIVLLAHARCYASAVPAIVMCLSVHPYDCHRSVFY